MAERRDQRTVTAVPKPIISRLTDVMVHSEQPEQDCARILAEYGDQPIHASLVMLVDAMFAFDAYLIKRAERDRME